MSGDKLTKAMNLLAEYAAGNLPSGYEVVLVFRSNECWLELQHDDDGDIEIHLDSQSHFVEACETAREYEKKRRGES